MTDTTTPNEGDLHVTGVQREVLEAHDIDPADYQPDEEPTVPVDEAADTAAANEEFEQARRTESFGEFTEREALELRELEAVFERNGGRGIDVAERIDQLRAKRDASLSGWRDNIPPVTDVTDPARPPFILSFVDGIVIGWDTCGECSYHIQLCHCPNGPHRPKYVEKWRREQEQYELRKAERDAERAREEAERAERIAADRAERERLRAEAETEAERTPTGRKRRKDAGQKRGPRNKEATDSVALAAGDLAAAMTPEIPNA